MEVREILQGVLQRGEECCGDEKGDAEVRGMFGRYSVSSGGGGEGAGKVGGTLQRYGGHHGGVDGAAEIRPSTTQNQHTVHHWLQHDILTANHC